MFDIFKSKGTKKEINRQKQYKRINVVFKTDEWEQVQLFLENKEMNLTQYVKAKLLEDMS